MLKEKSNLLPFSLPAVIILGVMSHCLHVEGLFYSHKPAHDSKNINSTHHIHIESETYGLSTFGMRSQPPATRPENDDGDDFL